MSQTTTVVKKRSLPDELYQEEHRLFRKHMKQTHQHCLEVMHPYFGLSSIPEPLRIVTEKKFGRHHAEYIQNKETLKPSHIFVNTLDKENDLVGWLHHTQQAQDRWTYHCFVSCLHETGHYLHNLARPELYPKERDYKSDAYYLREIAAETTPILFSKETGTFSKFRYIANKPNYVYPALWQLWKENSLLLEKSLSAPLEESRYVISRYKKLEAALS